MCPGPFPGSLPLGGMSAACLSGVQQLCCTALEFTCHSMCALWPLGFMTFVFPDPMK